MRGAEVTGSGTEGRPVTKQPGTEQAGAVYSSSHRPQAETPSKHHTKEQDKYNPGTLQLSNPYEQPFTIKAALSLQIPDKELQYHLQGFNLNQDSRTSKYNTHTTHTHHNHLQPQGGVPQKRVLIL